MTLLGIKTQDEPRIVRDAREIKSGYEVVTGKVKIKYRREEVVVFDNPSDAREWLQDAKDERVQTLENRICHIQREAAVELERLRVEEMEAEL